ncbi:MAG: hypothetical protein U9Q79_10270, partial [Candidatus Hydrogenedentes bacterium]|nr:hypothetical protein [Candidatus Hydrogenedentota bacterium]
MENHSLIEFFLNSVGISGDLAENIGQVAFAFQRPRLLWIGLALLVPAAYFVYRRQERNLTTVRRGLRVALSATRVAILAILILILAGPYIKLDEQIEKKPLVALLFDDSRSMLLPAGIQASDEAVLRVAELIGYSLPDGQLTAEVRKAVNQTSRAELARAAVEKAAEPLIDALAESYEVQYFSFADTLRPMPGASPSELPPPEESSGRATGIGDAILSLFEQAAGARIAGVVLLSDGEQTSGRPAEEAAEAAAKLGTPIFVVPPGSSERFHDVSIVDVFTSGLVAVGDTAVVSVTLESSGLDGQTAEVRLLDG